MRRVENYLYELKEVFGFEINENFENYVLTKYNTLSDSDDSELQMRQQVLYDLHFYQIESFKETSKQMDEDYHHFFAHHESLIDEHSRAMKILDKLGLTHLLFHPEFGLFEDGIPLNDF